MYHIDTNQKKINVSVLILYKEGIWQDILLEVVIMKSVQKEYITIGEIFVCPNNKTQNT